MPNKCYISLGDEFLHFHEKPGKHSRRSLRFEVVEYVVKLEPLIVSKVGVHMVVKSQ